MYNLVARDDEIEVNPAAKTLGVALTPWSPLGGGYLTGAKKKGEPGDTLRAKSMDQIFQVVAPKDSDWLVIDRVVELAQKKGVPPAQVSLAWLLSKPEVTSPIIGVTKLSHLEDAIAATKLQLTPEEIKYLEELYKWHGPAFGRVNKM